MPFDQKTIDGSCIVCSMSFPSVLGLNYFPYKTEGSVIVEYYVPRNQKEKQKESVF